MTHFGIHNFPATKYKIASGQIKSLCIQQNLQGAIFQKENISTPEWKKTQQETIDLKRSRNIMYTAQEDQKYL